MRKNVVAMPCRFIVISSDRYHECSHGGEVDGCCVFLFGDLIIEPTLTYTAKPSKFSFTGNPDEGTFNVAVTGYKIDVDNPKMTPTERPELTYDTLCPAGYTWKQVEDKFDATYVLCPLEPWEISKKKCVAVNAQIRELFKNISIEEAV